MRTRIRHLVSHVISLLVSASLSLFQSEAPPGKHFFFQEDTVHRAPLLEPFQSTRSAYEPLSHVNHESGGNPRNISHTSSMPSSLPVSFRSRGSRFAVLEYERVESPPSVDFDPDTPSQEIVGACLLELTRNPLRRHVWSSAQLA